MDLDGIWTQFWLHHVAKDFVQPREWFHPDTRGLRPENPVERLGNSRQNLAGGSDFDSDAASRLSSKSNRISPHFVGRKSSKLVKVLSQGHPRLRIALRIASVRMSLLVVRTGASPREVKFLHKICELEPVSTAVFSSCYMYVIACPGRICHGIIPFPLQNPGANFSETRSHSVTRSLDEQLRLNSLKYLAKEAESERIGLTSVELC